MSTPTIYFVIGGKFRVPARLVSNKSARDGKRIFELKMASEMRGRTAYLGLLVTSVVIGTLFLILDTPRCLNYVDILVISVTS